MAKRAKKYHLDRRRIYGYISWRSWGANPTTVSYNATAVKIYNAESSKLRFGKQKYFLYLENKNILFIWKNALACYDASIVVVKSDDLVLGSRTSST
jgi:hypothetical protein